MSIMFIEYKYQKVKDQRDTFTILTYTNDRWQKNTQNHT